MVFGPAALPESPACWIDSNNTMTMNVADNQPVILLILRPAPTPSVLSS